MFCKPQISGGEVCGGTMDVTGALWGRVTATAAMKLLYMLLEYVETGSLESNIAAVMRLMDKQSYLCGLE